MKNILCALLAVVAAATGECLGAIQEDVACKFWTQDNGGGDLGPLVQAHRGSRGEYQDNAAGGFAWCLGKGIRGFEVDIRFTSDHRLVIMHDSRMERTTDGTGVVERLSFDEFRAARLRACPEPPPTVEEILAPLAGRDDVLLQKLAVEAEVVEPRR